MNKKKHSPMKLRGAVLIMVLTIMFVLIFLLAGSIAVVYSSNNRAMDKYRQSQSYYTVRSVLDTYVETLLKDNDNKMSGTNYNYYVLEKDPTTGTNKAVAAKDPTGAAIVMTQGRALELDIYKLRAPIEDKSGNSLVGANDTATIGKIKQAYNDGKLSDMLTEQMGKAIANGLSDDDAAKLVFNNINPTSTDFSDYNTDTAKYYDQFLPGTDSKVTYKINSAQLASYRSGTDGSYGKVVDDGSEAFITVELLERYFDPSATGATFTDVFVNGNRKKDHIKVKITAQIVYNDEIVRSSMIYSTKYENQPVSSEAIKAFGEMDGGTSGLPATGGFSSHKQDGRTTLDAGNVVGSVYVENDLSFKAAGGGTIGEGCSIQSKGDVWFENTTNLTAFGDNTFIYAGTIFKTRGGTIGDSTHKIDVICGGLNYSNPTTINGNFYIDDFSFKKAVDFNSNGLQDFNPGYFKVNGDIYANTLEFDSAALPNFVEIDASNSEVKFKISESNKMCNIFNYNKIIIDGIEQSSYTVKFYDDAGNDGSSTSVNKLTSALKFGYNDGDAYTYNETSFKKEITLPGRTEKVILDTTRSKFNSYYKAEDFKEESSDKGYGGDLKNPKIDDSTNPSPVESAEDRAKKVSGVGDNCKLSDASLPTYSLPQNVSYDLTITDNGKISFPQNPASGSYIVDTSDHDIVLEYAPNGSSNYLTGTIKVTGPNKLYLLFPSNLGTINHGGQTFQIIYQDTLDAGIDVTGTTTPSPPIQIYVGSGTDISMEGNSFITGYIYAPKSEIHFESNGTLLPTTYNGNALPNMKYSVVGSVTCKKFSCQNGAGVAFVNEGNDNSVPGERTFAWDDVLYTRGG